MQRYVDEDILRVYKLGEKREEKNLLATLFWGDTVQVVEKVGNVWKLDFTKQIWNKDLKKYEWIRFDGAIPVTTRFCTDPLLKIRFVDVGQGDAAIIESPKGKIILIDGGEGDSLSYYVSRAWAHILRYKPLDVEAIVISHGDADHYAGMTKLLERKRSKKQPLINVKRVYQSGILRAKSSGKETERLGPTTTKNNRTYIVDLVDDPRTTPDSRMNKPSQAWKKALASLTLDPSDLKVERISYGSDQAFDFLSDEGIHIQVLGPIAEELNGKPALPFLHEEKGSGLSSSQTINGHSIVLRLTYGNLHVLFGADLNAESETGLLEQLRKDDVSIASEILKVPHHGSADFNPRMLEAVRPTVSVISSGDENALAEYIHPRAGLVGALGKYSNSAVEKPLIYVTEMVAFFEKIGKAQIQKLEPSGKKDGEPYEETDVYHKKSYGIVHIRTDGKRVLIVTHGGKPDQKESYAFNVDGQGGIVFEEKTNVV